MKAIGLEPVDKIVGPGNLFVALAKQHVFGTVDIDSIAGPSEVVLIADRSAVPAFVAADLISQAEHSPGASILLTWEPGLIDQVAQALEDQLARLSRGGLARDSLERFGALVLVRDEDEAIAISNQIAPEHLHVSTADPKRLLPRLTNAGAIFLGHFAPVAAGDYAAGPSHVLPTGGTARWASGLSANDFLKRSSLIALSRDGLAALAPDIRLLADKEGLSAHRSSVDLRLDTPRRKGSVNARWPPADYPSTGPVSEPLVRMPIASCSRHRSRRREALRRGVDRGCGAHQSRRSCVGRVIRVGSHLVAAWWLESQHGMVVWDIDETNWRQGGVTSVSFASRNFVESADSATAISITFSKLHRVVSLNLAENDRITNKGLAELRGLDFLTELNLDRLNRYRHSPVRIASAPLTDACLVHLQALPRLENLSLAGNLITDQGLSQIARMANSEDSRSRGHRGQRCRSGLPRGDEEPRSGQPGGDPCHQGGYRAAPDGQAGPDDRARRRTGGGARSQAASEE